MKTNSDASGLYSSPVLLCPAGLLDAPNLNHIVKVLRFRNGVIDYTDVQSTPDQRRAVNTFGSGLTWGVLTHYMVNGTPAGWTGSPATTQLRPFECEGLGAPHGLLQSKLSQIHNAGDTWMASETRSADFGMWNVIFRHPGDSANFLYCDGHVERLKTVEVDAYMPGSFPVWTTLLNADAPGIGDQRMILH